MLINRLLAISPWIEVAVKYIYWHFPHVNRALSYVLKKIRRKPAATGKKIQVVSKEVAPKIWKQLSDWGVCDGNILIVHSSMGNLKGIGLSPDQIIAKLQSLIGPKGTLAMPAIPYFPEEPTGVDRLSDKICKIPVAYNVEQTPPWTGALPKALMQTQGAVRSHHPLSTMVACGPEAEDMMCHNLDEENPLASGCNSSWYYCAKRNAKIVALGTDMAHSLTMIHVAEDAYDKDWPIENWYRLRLFDITSKGKTSRVYVRERHPKWAIHYAERTLAKDLRAAGIIHEANIHGISMEYCESDALLAYLNARKASGYPYFILKLYKKRVKA